MIQPVTCPICHKQLSPEECGSAHFPFCSVRCKQIDLTRWLDGKYTIVEQVDPRELPLDALGDDCWPDETQTGAD